MRVNELKKTAGYLEVIISEGTYELKPSILEPVLEANKDLIDQFSWIPYELDRNSYLQMKKSMISDYSRNGET